MDCGEVFEWHAVDDVGRCGRCYQRFVKGEGPLNPGAGTHPDKRYVALDALKAALTRTHVVLANMAAEIQPHRPWHSRWPIHHEPLRADARRMLPIVDAALALAEGKGK